MELAIEAEKLASALSPLDLGEDKTKHTEAYLSWDKEAAALCGKAPANLKKIFDERFAHLQTVSHLNYDEKKNLLGVLKSKWGISYDGIRFNFTNANLFSHPMNEVKQLMNDMGRLFGKAFLPDELQNEVGEEFKFKNYFENFKEEIFNLWARKGKPPMFLMAEYNIVVQIPPSDGSVLGMSLADPDEARKKIAELQKTIVDETENHEGYYANYRGFRDNFLPIQLIKKWINLLKDPSKIKSKDKLIDEEGWEEHKKKVLESIAELEKYGDVFLSPLESSNPESARDMAQQFYFEIGERVHFDAKYIEGDIARDESAKEIQVGVAAATTAIAAYSGGNPASLGRAGQVILPLESTVLIFIFMATFTKAEHTRLD